MLSPRSSGDDESVENYPSGSRASAFKADGSGFISYPSGRVAVCIGVIDGRSRYYLYGDDARSTPLGAVNEHAVGFFLGPAGVRLALSKVGGLITDRHGYIVREWRYDLGAHMPPPTGVLEVRLNKSMSFEFLNRGDMRIKFSHEGISHELDAGVRPKRMGTYLDNSIRLPGGRLQPQLDRISLVSRQQTFGNAMKAKRDRLKPRSRNLAICKGLVAGLENGFDGMAPQVEPFPDPSWKDDALGATCRELPRIRSTGLEVGPTQGLGRTIYDDERDRDNHSSASGGPGMRRSRSWGGGGGNGEDGDAFSTAARLRKDGKWLGELDVRLQVYAENPLLKRSSLLQAASGRYAEEIVVPGGKTSVSNPTGKATVSGVPLHRVPASRLRAFLEEEAGPEQLVVVLGVRGDDTACGKVQTTAELTNRFLLQRYAVLPGGGDSRGGEDLGGAPSVRASSSSSSTGEKYRMVKVDFAEHQATAELYGVKALPAFLMFQGGRLAWAGTLGGCPLKSAPPDTVAAGQRVLLVEPCAKAQMATERALRKFGCSWDLVLSAPQALLRIQVAKTNAMASEIGGTAASGGGGEGYGVLMISDALGATEVIALEKAFHGGGVGHGSDSVVVGLARMHGDAAAASNAALKVVSAGFTEAPDRKRAVLSPHLALVADMAVTKPVRSSALKAVFRCCKRRRDEAGGGGGRGGGGGKQGDGKGGTLSMSASCSTLEGGDRRYKGVTPSRLLEKMEEIGAQVAMGIFASNRAAGAGRQHRPGAGASSGNGEILVPAQETSCRGFMLERSTLQHLTRTA